MNRYKVVFKDHSERTVYADYYSTGWQNDVVVFCTREYTGKKTFFRKKIMVYEKVLAVNYWKTIEVI